MGAVVFILFCLGVLVGVILLIVYFSLPEKKQQEPGNKAMVIKAQGRTEMSVYDDPNIPKNFDENFFKERILKIRNSPNVVHDLITAWETKFKSRQEKKILREIEDWYNHIRNISEAEAGALLATAAAKDARTDLLTSEKEEYQVARGNLKVRTVQADLADVDARIREAEARGRPPEKAAGKEEEKKKPTPKEWIARLEKVINQQIGDITRIDSLVAEHFTALADKEKEEKGQVDTNPLLSPEEKAERKREINARYRNLRDDINRLVNVIRIESKKRRS